MVYLYTAILCGYLILWILSLKEEGKGPFRRMAMYFWHRGQKSRQKRAGRRRNWQRDLYRRQLGNKLKILRPEMTVQTQIQNHYVSLYSLVLAVGFMGAVICLCAWIAAHGSPLLQEGRYLLRNSYGQGEVPVSLSARVKGKEEEIFEYIVEERKYTEAEAEDLYAKAVRALPKVIRGQNESLEDVRTHLDLVTELEGYPFAISWESDSYSIVDTDGTVSNEELQEGVVVGLTAHFQYERSVWEYQMYVRVNPKLYTKQELLRRRIEELLNLQGEHTSTAEKMVLPEKIDSVPIVWREIIEDSSGYLMLLVLSVALLLHWIRSREPDRQLESRRKELLLDYPEIVNKLALYMGAGMTIRNAFFKMGEDYKKQQKERKRYAYEEILMTCYELQSGRSEKEAYDHFGKRCQVQAYRKLCTLLSQNLRKGSNDLLRVLRQEADNAFAERKNLAKKLGEEAGTKLLLPMMMMLCIVMVVIMIPAYFSFIV